MAQWNRNSEFHEPQQWNRGFNVLRKKDNYFPKENYDFKERNGYNRKQNNNDNNYEYPQHHQQHYQQQYQMNNNQNKWSNQMPLNSNIESELFGHQQQAPVVSIDEREEIPVRIQGPGLSTEEHAGVVAFEELRLTKIMRDNITLLKYKRPTPVQRFAIPIILQGRDVMACAQTGSGKTAAFLIPLLDMIYQEGPGDSLRISNNYDRKYPIALILVPTRELACQIFDETRKFSYRSQVRSCVVYGGADISKQIYNLSHGCNILVATPGRLIDLISRNKVGLEYIRYFVLDEADRMLDMGFEPQIRQIVEKFDMPYVENRQTLMFSATFPQEIQRLASEFLNHYVFLAVGIVGSSSHNITQHVMFIEEYRKRNHLLGILSNLEPEDLVLVFVETKKGARILEKFLLQRNFPVTSIHGDRKQTERESALKCFKDGSSPILVATAVAARGLDIPNVKVIKMKCKANRNEHFRHLLLFTFNSDIFSDRSPTVRNIFQCCVFVFFMLHVILEWCISYSSGLIL